MRSWTLVPPLVNSIATQTRLWACASEATHPKKRSSSRTSVTGSPTGKDAPDTGQDSWTATIALLSIVALRVLGVCEAPACEGPLAPGVLRQASPAAACYRRRAPQERAALAALTAHQSPG